MTKIIITVSIVFCAIVGGVLYNTNLSAQENTKNKSAQKAIVETAKASQLKVEEQKPAEHNIEEVKVLETVKEMPAVVTSNTISTQNNKLTTQTYTNQYFPFLKIKYDSDWKMTNQTKASSITDGKLLERTITLTKGDTAIVYSIFPGFGTGCSNDDLQRPLAKVSNNINNTGISRFKSLNTPGFVYTSDNKQAQADCLLSHLFGIKSNIKMQDFGPVLPDIDNNVVYWMTVKVTGTQHLTEADCIMGNSTFK
jgi:hypothetical protein